MKLTILSPEGEKLSADGLSAVELPGAKGRFVVLAGHAPLISSLDAGVVRYDSDEGRSTFEIKGGFVEIIEDNIIVCAD